MMQKYFRMPDISCGRIVCELSSKKETFYCHVLTGSWDYRFTSPELKELGPYDTYGEALIALVEYGNELLRWDKYYLKELKELIDECNMLPKTDQVDKTDPTKT